jgi:hypothetical protein
MPRQRSPQSLFRCAAPVPRPLARPAGSLPSHTSTRSATNRVKLVVITAVDGASLSEICTRTFCIAIAQTPSMAAKIMTAALGSAGEPASMDTTRNPASNRNCRSNSGLRVAIPNRSSAAARSRAANSRMMNTGTDRRCAADACSPAAVLAASTTRLPVTWAMNRAPRPRNPITSTLPAMTLSTNINNFVPSRSLTDSTVRNPVVTGSPFLHSG